MNRLQVIKIALLIVILAEEIREVLSKLKIENCDVCSTRQFKFQLLHDNNLTICDECASHFNDMNVEN
ncbi:hypothetical protein CD172_03790 [Staphylococcus agnetis]|nr:hypothetical protein CD172_03790 [Staphylococcus agnetis]